MKQTIFPINYNTSIIIENIFLKKNLITAIKTKQKQCQCVLF